MKHVNKRLLWIISALFVFTFPDSGRVLGQDYAQPASPSAAAEPAHLTRSGDGAAAPKLQSEPRVQIGPGDLIEMNVFDVPELTQVVRVNDVGDASFNLIGEVHVSGLTTDQASLAIARQLKKGKFVLDPQVAVFIREYSTQGVSVVGAVNKPGVYGVLGSQTLLDVLAAAGGTTPFAGPEVTIKRKDGSIETARLSRDAHMSLSANLRLYPSDIVIVPRAGLVYVIGDVGRPGGFIMENEGHLTILQALAMAGGHNHTASLSHAKLIRNTATGYSTVPIQLKKIVGGGESDQQLQVDDILYVPSNAVKSMFSRTVPSIVSSASGAAIYRSVP